MIIPTFNLGGMVKQAITSVLDQTYQDFEIIVVDDGSIDDTRAVVTAIPDRRVHYIYQTNKGLAEARNAGIAQASGSYIAFLDADDLFLKHKLALQVPALDDQPHIGLVAGGYVFISETGQPLANRYPWFYSPQLDLKTWLRGCPFVVHAVLIRREWLSRVGGFDPALRRLEDRDLWLRLAYQGCQMRWIPEIVCAYRMHSGQMVREGRSQQEIGLVILDKFFALADLSPELLEEKQRAYAYQYLEGACRQYAASQIEGGRQSLAQTIAMEPRLMEGDMPLLASALVSWAIDPIVGDPIIFISRVLDNLPTAALPLVALRERLFGEVAVRAAIEANLVGNRSLARQHLTNAFRADSSWAGDPARVIEILVDAVSGKPIERQIECIEAFFESVPSELKWLASFRRHALGRLYAARGFEAHAAGATRQAARWLWQGARLDPAWLRNRGVWSIIIRSLFASPARQVLEHGSVMTNAQS